jgi:electron transfer flavoprotein beta subunit
MKIVVCMKQVIDLAQIRYQSDRRTPLLKGLPVLLGQFEKHALEEAVQIKESREGVQVIALAAGGGGKLKDSIKEALAIGADEAVLVVDPALDGSDAAGSAQVLATAIEKLGDVDLIMLGEGSDDEYSGQIPSRLAALLDLPQITYVRSLEIRNGNAHATRDLEKDLEIVECNLPVVISVTSELNVPRLPPLTAILKAGGKPMHEWTLDDIGLNAEQVGSDAAKIEVFSNLAPAQDRKNVTFDGDLDEQLGALLQALEHDGVII